MGAILQVTTRPEEVPSRSVTEPKYQMGTAKEPVDNY
jgi:hypothetical protein